MKSPHRTVLALAAALAVAAVAQADTLERQMENLARFEKHAGAPIDSFFYPRLYQWQALGKEAVAVWSGVNKVYLLKVAKPCINLDWAKTIGVTASGGTVKTRFDYVTFDHQRCQIASIQPVDYAAVRAEMSTQKAEKDR
ncbi:MAG: DUF6491 family protein [Mizugakiibacter sp.]|uniref:DUF6491 family protein n=1 Tax=Mizugakiibacter sp. TaxID=1972610 RepID=UPI0031C24612|nr:DUF6491 family protein [Xanthomonadaceae bacterium]